MIMLSFFKAPASQLSAIAAIALTGIAMTSCLHFEMAQPARPAAQPQPTSIAITGIPDNHNERQAVVRLLNADNEVAFARPVHIVGGSVRLDMLETGTDAPILARGNYIVDLVVSIRVTGREHPVPAFIGQITSRNISNGINSISWNDFTPAPVSLTITGISGEHNGRMASVRLVNVDANNLEVANAPHAQITGGTVTLNMMNTETQEEFFARGIYLIGFVISGTIGGRTIPVFGAALGNFSITGGPQTIPFPDFANTGL